jgi:indolepyruvate ferredoxin oxidoreductase beta subunit
MEQSKKMLVAGVGGQGVVFLTNVIVEAAILADLTVASSEIHGLAQRGGSVVAGITVGDNTYGFVERGGADFLIGLELLEAQRCLPFLKVNSRVVIDNRKMLPYAVNAQHASYPDSQAFIEYLGKNTGQVLVISDSGAGLDPILRNIHVLGGATTLKNFPVPCEYIEKAVEIVSMEGYKEQTLQAFRMGRAYDTQ